MTVEHGGPFRIAPPKKREQRPQRDREQRAPRQQQRRGNGSNGGNQQGGARADASNIVIRVNYDDDDE